jgi:peptidyl-prolyl cis-trans isomerase C
MLSQIRYPVASLIVAVLGLFAAACGVTAPSPARIEAASNSAATPLPPVVATVNGQPIPTKLYEMYLKNGHEAAGIDPSTDEGRRRLERLREGIVSELIDRAVIRHEAKRRQLAVSPERMAEAERRAVADMGGEQQYDAYLAGHGLTRDEYREVLKTSVYGELMRAELSKGVAVSDAEVKAFYDAHRHEAAFQQPERVTASHLLIAARPNLIARQLQQEKNLTGEALAAAVREEMGRRRRRAEELRGRAAAGADFAALARQHSEDPGTRARGGDLGSFTRDSHPRAFDDAAFALKPGAVSAVVQTDFGFHVIKVAAREPARAQTLAEAAPEIRRRLLAEREAAQLKDWLKAARRRADIRLNDPFRFGALKDEFPIS